MKKFFPNSPHWNDGYRISLGTWTSETGDRWDLGVAELHWANGEKYYSDFSLPNEQVGGYYSGSIRWNHFPIGMKEENKAWLERYNELIRRANVIGIDVFMNGYDHQVYWGLEGHGAPTPQKDLEYLPIDPHTNWTPDDEEEYEDPMTDYWVQKMQDEQEY